MGKTAPPREHRSCSFCHQPRAAVGHLVAGPGVSICDGCIVLAGRALEDAPRPTNAWGAIVAEMAITCPAADAPQLLEPLTRAACALYGDNEDGLRYFARRLAEAPSAIAGRAVLLVSNAIGAARDDGDNERMLVAALCAGELEIACGIEHRGELPAAVALSALAPLLRARRGDADVELHAARVREAARTLAADAAPAERAMVVTTLALAELRCGVPPARSFTTAGTRICGRGTRSRHGDAKHLTGDDAGAAALWAEVARETAFPFWAEQAAERLATLGAPYRT